MNLGGKLYVDVVSRVLTTLTLGYNKINENKKKQLRDAVQGREGFNLYI